MLTGKIIKYGFLFTSALSLLPSCKVAQPYEDSELLSEINQSSLISMMGTIFKESPSGGSSGDCAITGVHQVSKFGEKRDSHIQVTLSASVPGCNGRKEGWIYEGHLDDRERMMTIFRQATLFDNNKQSICQVKPKVVPMVTDFLKDGNFTKFRPIPEWVDELPESCPKLETYYISTASIAPGIQGIRITADTVLKSDPSFQGSTLNKTNVIQNAQKACFIPAGFYMTSAPVKVVAGNHYEVVFANPIDSIKVENWDNSDLRYPTGKLTCQFNGNKGYVFVDHTAFRDPKAGESSASGFGGSGGCGGKYCYPLKNTSKPGMTSRWCQYRNIGTSPHVGTDFVDWDWDKEMWSQAIADGTISEVTYQGGCGWDVWLKDVNGATWRYLHCDKPLVNGGQRVKAGTTLCKHDKYPIGCGSGAHLHLERYSGGSYPGGSKPGCLWDSESPFTSGNVK